MRLASKCSQTACVEILGSGRSDSRERVYTARMSAKHRGAKGNDKTPKPDPVQEIAVYHIDLMAEVEGLLRSLTRTQQQVERLRSGGEAGAWRSLSAAKL
jgi:hypothetical protein